MFGKRIPPLLNQVYCSFCFLFGCFFRYSTRRSRAAFLLQISFYSLWGYSSNDYRGRVAAPVWTSGGDYVIESKRISESGHHRQHGSGE